MAKKSGFQFNDFIVTKSIILRGGSKSNYDYDFDIEPAGIVNESEKTFQLTLEIKLADDNDQLVIQVQSIGFFKYSGDLESIKPFLFLNAPAIMFPYLRSYLSSVTALSGLDTITIPTMNLTGLKNQLEENITLIEDKKV